MRKAQKEQICNIIKLLEKAHNAIQKNVKENKIRPVVELLGDCQESAIVIGSQIEKTEGIGFITVQLLEKYCELSYQFYEYIKQLDEEQKKEIKKSLKMQKILHELNHVLVQISDSIENDITIRKEVVFLPYKASMWDSLESVWKAADEDPNCDAYVIPIPYFDRNADGSFGELHYEGDLYPKNVPITHYKEFDLEEHRPNKIFIHNPYDEYNRVTSVHPDFYSKKLKSYTENLIYIPYFVLSEVDIENDTAVQNMEHFCKVPAVLYADKVIVQSEQMKQVYVKVLTEWQGKHTKQKWEEKILGLGSPKMDKVVNTSKDDLEIPKEWQSIIQKTDGSRKKIVFYNTSLSAFLEHSDSYLEKIEDVLNVFWQEKEEVVLLWRPHPLMQTTMKSMRPEVEEKYLEIVRKYKDEKWGIYDDTPDLDRAIRLADAYYGDPSSVVQLCQKVGMPVMIQDVEINYG